MKATKGHIIFYKSKCVEVIQKKLNNDGAHISTPELDDFLKGYAGIQKSCTEMTREELNTLIEWSKNFAMSIGLDLDDNNEIQFKW